MMRIDPRLGVSADAAYDIETAVGPLLEPVTVIVTSRYDAALAAEIVGEDVLIRAATGDEVTDLLTTGGCDEEEGVDWPGDPAEPTGQEIVWQATADAEAQVEPACRLWAGEVILNTGRGVSGPFCVYEAAARAWAFSTALGMPPRQVLEAHVVPYACARSCAPELVRRGEAEFRRVNRFWAAPIRPWGEPSPVPFPR